VAGLLFVEMLGVPSIRVLADILILRKAPPERRGRVVAALMVLIAVGMPAGVGGCGLLLQYLPAQIAMLTLAAAMVLAVGYGLSSRDLRNARWPSLQKLRGRAGERQRVEAELAMVPGPDALDHDAYRDPLVEHQLNCWPHRFAVRAVVTLPHAHANRPQRVRILDDDAAAVERDTLQGVVGVARLNQHRDPLIAAEVHRLLRLGLGLEPHLVIDDGVPHGRQVRAARGADRGQRRHPLLAQERGDFAGGHDNPVALFHATASLTG
jgi:hypothetical protein